MIKLAMGLLCLCLLIESAPAQDDVIKTPLVMARIAQLYKAALPTYVLGGIEYSFTVAADGIPNHITSSNTAMSNLLVVSSTDKIIVHTHPLGASPKPSGNDIQISVHTGKPNYVLSRFALWVAMPDGTFHKVADVKFKHGKLVLEEGS